MELKNLKITLLFILYFSSGLHAPGQDIKYEDSDYGMLRFDFSDKQKEDLKISDHIVEVSHGQAFVDWHDSWAWMFSGNYLYRVHRKIAVGGGAGLQLDWTGIYPIISLNSIFGNKSSGFAFGADLRYMTTRLVEDESGRIWINAGCYYKNFFIKVMPTFIFGWPGEWAIETGYSFDIGR